VARIPTFGELAAGVDVEGLTHQTSVDAATVWATKGEITKALISALSLTGWERGAIMSVPDDVVARGSDGLTASIDTSPLAFRLELHHPGVSGLFMARARPDAPDGQITADLDRSSTTVQASSGLSGIVYAGRETILLGAEGPAGTYTGCTRNFAGSGAYAHAAGKNVYLRPPYLKGRRVRFWVARATGAEIWWTGYLESAVPGEVMTTLVIQGQDRVQGLIEGRGQIGGDMPDLRASGSGRIEFRAGVPYAVGRFSYERRVRKPGIVGPRIALQFQGALVIGRYDLGEVTVEGVLPELGSRFTEPGPNGELTEPVREVFLVSRELDALYSNGVSATQDLGEPYNPVEICRALLGATPSPTRLIDPLEVDVLTQHWGLDARGHIEPIRWAEAVQATRDVQIDTLLLGWDGEPVDTLDLLVDLLRWAGLMIGHTQTGLMIPVAASGVLSVEDYCLAQGKRIEILSPASGGLFAYDPGAASPLSTVRALVGERPWRDAERVPLNLDGQDVPDDAVSDRADFTLNLPFIDASRVATWGDGDAGDELVGLMASLGVISRWATPELTVRAVDGAIDDVDFDQGADVQIGFGGPVDPLFPLPDGTYAALPSGSESTQIRWTARIQGMGRRPTDTTTELRLRPTAWATGQLARLRAPASPMIAFDAVAGSATASSSELFGDDAPLGGFAVGDQVAFWHADGVRYAQDEGTGVLTSVEGDQVIIDPWPLSGSPGSASPPLVMRLADSVIYSNASRVSCDDRAWAYLADPSGAVGRPDGDEPGDIYG